jgi:hypothetical protein
MIKLSDIRGDNQYVIGLELHKGSGWDKAVHGYRGPSDLFQDTVHSIHIGDMLDGNPRFLQAGHIGFMGYPAEVVNVLTHHIAPDGLVYRGIILVILRFYILSEVGGESVEYGVAFVAHNVIFVSDIKIRIRLQNLIHKKAFPLKEKGSEVWGIIGVESFS